MENRKSHTTREIRIGKKFDFLEGNLARAFTGEFTGKHTGIDDFGKEKAHRILMACKREIKDRMSKLPSILLTEEDQMKYEKVLDKADEILNDTYRHIFLGSGRMKSRKCSQCVYSSLHLPEDFELI